MTYMTHRTRIQGSRGRARKTGDGFSCALRLLSGGVGTQKRKTCGKKPCSMLVGNRSLGLDRLDMNRDRGLAQVARDGVLDPVAQRVRLIDARVPRHQQMEFDKPAGAGFARAQIVKTCSRG